MPNDLQHSPGTRHRRSRRLTGLCAVVVGLAASGFLSAPSATAQGLATAPFGYTGTIQTWPVPTGVQSVSIEITGGAGGAGSNGAFTYATTLTGTLTIPTGVSALDVTVGGQGGSGFLGSTGQGGWPNGGSGGGNGFQYWGAGGGGSSDIRPSGAPFTSALVVMGGAGGTGGYGGTSLGGVGGWGGFDGAGFGQPGSGSDGGAGGAGGNQPTGSDGRGGAGQTAANTNSGGGGGGGGGWNGGTGGSAGTADMPSFFSGGGGGGGGGIGSVVRDYVTGINWFTADQQASVQITYLGVAISPIPTLAVGTWASWRYDAGPDATYALTSGVLPPGLTFDGYSGWIQGVPTQTGTYTFTIESSVYPDGTNAVSTASTTTVTVNTGGPADLVATSATDIGTTSATANGAVIAGGAPVTGLQCVYSATNPGGGAITGTAVAATPTAVAPTPTGVATGVSCALTGLNSNQTYYYQVRGTQLGTTVRSGTATFTTDSAPTQPFTLPATNVGETTATGRGTVSATQNVTSIVCRASTSLGGLAAGTSFTASPASTTGPVSAQTVSCPMTGLTPNSIYFYAVFATDASGTTMSPVVQTFLTRLSPPQLGPISAASVGATSAVIAGTVTPTNEIVTGTYCRYVASHGNPARGTAVAASPFQLGAAAVERATTCTLTGLAPATTYLVRMEATDRTGSAGSPNVVRFTTSAADTPVTPAPTLTIQSAFALGAGRVRARATINGPGTLTLLASRATTRTNRRAQVCRANRTIAGGGTYTITCRVGKATRRVQRTRRVPIRVRVTYSPVEGPAVSATVDVLLPRVAPHRRGAR